MPIYGACVVRVSDRVLLHQTNRAAGSGDDTLLTISPALWADVVSKCGAPNFRTSSFAEETWGGDGSTGKKRVGYHIMSDDEIAFGLITDEATTRRTAHLALDDVSKLFRKMFVEQPKKLTANACDVFKQPLQQLMARYSEHGAVDDKIQKVKRTVDEVKVLALDNVDRVLARGQQIDEIITATDDLQTQAQGFQRNSRALRSQMWWNNAKAKIVIAGAVAFFLFVVYLIFCGGISCSSSSSSTS